MTMVTCTCVFLVDSLGINNDLKNKLQDVLIPERLLTLGHMLGKGKTHTECMSKVVKTH